MTLNLFETAEFKDYARIKTDKYDDKIRSIRDQVSAAVERLLNRNLEDPGGDSTEYYSGKGTTSSLRLHRYPITSITSIHVDSTRTFDSTTLVPATEYVFEAAQGIVHYVNIDRCWPRGRQNIKVIYRGGYTQAAVPEPLKLGALLYALAIWNKSQDMGLATVSVSSFSQTFRKETIPAEAMALFGPYKKVPIVQGGV